jgi:hypothetical protein
MTILALIFLFITGCDKEDSEDFRVRIILINDLGAQTSLFDEGELLTFKFYLTNHTGKDALYSRPCPEFGWYLKVYKKDFEGVYQYYGQPKYVCSLIAVTDSIKAGETILLTTLPWKGEFGCPELLKGEYFVGDTFTLNINNEMQDFIKRIYFEIE